MKNLHPSSSGNERGLGPAHPLLRIVIAAALATVITWLGGLLFGSMSEARARQLAQAMSAPLPRGTEAVASSTVRNRQADARVLPSGPAAQARMSG